ncbi:cell division protein ZapA [Bacteroides sp. OttesenSCG-928-E20]|nr:cell division protein ZapA [Bacteroides sp. OttesenSCG-928-E20]
MDDQIKINLQIADNNYPLTIKRSDEEMVRKAAKQVNLKLNKYRVRYPTLGLEKVLGMVAYDLSLKILKLEDKNDTVPYTEKMKELTEELEEYLERK